MAATPPKWESKTAAARGSDCLEAVCDGYFMPAIMRQNNRKLPASGIQVNLPPVQPALYYCQTTRHLTIPTSTWHTAKHIGKNKSVLYTQALLPRRKRWQGKKAASFLGTALCRDMT